MLDNRGRLLFSGHGATLHGFLFVVSVFDDDIFPFITFHNRRGTPTEVISDGSVNSVREEGGGGRAGHGRRGRRWTGEEEERPGWDMGGQGESTVGWDIKEGNGQSWV